jgi:hypothetical protein
VALRISFANCCFFLFHAALLVCCTEEDDPRTLLHTGLWFWRLVVWTGTILGFFFVPASAVAVYGQIARAGAAIFLVFIMVELVTWFYDLSARLVDADTRWAWAGLVGGAALSFAGGWRRPCAGRAAGGGGGGGGSWAAAVGTHCWLGGAAGAWWAAAHALRTHC